MKRAPKAGKPSAMADSGDPKFARVIAAFAADRQVTQAKMFGAVGLKVNGKVFAMVVKGKLVVKLPKGRVDALVAAGSVEYFDPGHGKPMKEWIAVPGAKPPWLTLSKEAYLFVKGVTR